MAGAMDLAVADTGVRELGVVTDVSELEVVDGVNVSTPDDDELVVTVVVVYADVLLIILDVVTCLAVTGVVDVRPLPEVMATRGPVEE